MDEQTFEQFATVWEERRGRELANAYDNKHRLQKIFRFQLPGAAAPTTFGQKPLTSITTDDVEAYRDHRKAQGLSAVTVNHDLRLLRKMFNWGIQKGHLERTPFKIGTEPAIRLEREIPRHRRFESDDDEQKLLAAANPHLRAVIIAMLDTACRPGEILNVQVRDVSISRRELTIRAVTEKTRRERVQPISKRLLAVLELRLLDPAGRPSWRGERPDLEPSGYKRVTSRIHSRRRRLGRKGSRRNGTRGHGTRGSRQAAAHAPHTARHASTHARYRISDLGIVDGLVRCVGSA